MLTSTQRSLCPSLCWSGWWWGASVRSPGSLFGGVFVLFVPNIAERVSTGLAGAIYGVILLLVIYVMPSGAAGFVRFAAARLKLRGKPR